tara:strand:- start:7 stop:237 length:231 start_codon:yes stop_codon:yes gene_type:complete
MAKTFIKKKLLKLNDLSNTNLRIDDHEKLCRIMQKETNNKIKEIKDKICRLEKIVLYTMAMVVGGMATIIYELLIK